MLSSCGNIAFQSKKIENSKQFAGNCSYSNIKYNGHWELRLLEWLHTSPKFFRGDLRKNQLLSSETKPEKKILADEKRKLKISSEINFKAGFQGCYTSVYLETAKNAPSYLKSEAKSPESCQYKNIWFLWINKDH